MKLMLQIRRRQVATLELKEGEDNLGVVKKQALDILGKEQEKFREFKKSEGIPENISAFQKHHLYCLDRFLNQNQVRHISMKIAKNSDYLAERCRAYC